MNRLLTIALGFLLLANCENSPPDPSPTYQLSFNELADSWDEAIPLGNGILGNLVWQKGERLRFSLDRSDLWDLRPMENIDFDQWTFRDVYDHWKNGQYDKVQQVFDEPYDQLPAPSKIPAGALEFDIGQLGAVRSVRLDIATATCLVEWESGVKLTTFVHANKPIGWYKFENLNGPLDITMDSPAYDNPDQEVEASQSPHDLAQLGYTQGNIEKGVRSLTYNQEGWGEFSYQIHTAWREEENSMWGCWSVSSSYNDRGDQADAVQTVSAGLDTGMEQSLRTHTAWWKDFWSQSEISIPDSLLQNQYHMEMYKLGSVARADAPPISLQAVWTADHGKLPPWKGDFHHDLNTQLSYWPTYTGNYLGLEEGFINWLWKHRPTFKRYTKSYFEAGGMNVPGVTTLDGEPMGGWIQYSLGPTVGAWLAHHFYLHWRYSMDRDFLKNKAYPWLKDIAVFLDEISIRTEEGKRKLLLSSSPEIFNNSAQAWFPVTTNYDLALIRWTYEKTAELARELGLEEESDKWEQILAEWPDLAIDPETGLVFAPGTPYNESHRHFSHLLGYHPLGIIDFSKGEKDISIVKNTLANLEAQGTDWWTGYSFSWQGILYARAFEGEKAAEALRIFTRCFCLKNTFHVNGDQCKMGYSNFTYRPFTLEGNFAFASAIQEMLIQSHTGIIRIFPAIPADWENVSFSRLRTMGAFLVSAIRQNGTTTEIEIVSEKGGNAWLQNPFEGAEFSSDMEFEEQNGVIKCVLQTGDKVTFRRVD